MHPTENKVSGSRRELERTLRRAQLWSGIALLVVVVSVFAALFSYAQLREAKLSLADANANLAEANETCAALNVDLEKHRALLVVYQDSLRVAIEELGQPTQELADLLGRAENAKYRVGLYSLESERSGHDTIVEYLRDRGYKLVEDSVYSARPSWLAERPTVLYYHPDTRPVARNLADALEEHTGNAFHISEGTGLGVSPGQEEWTLFIHFIEAAQSAGQR